MPIISALVYTVVDHMGTPRTVGWLTLEFTGTLVGGGQAFDLSPYYRSLDRVVPYPMSGGELRAPYSGEVDIMASGSKVFAQPVITDYATPASARIQLYGVSTVSGRGMQQITSGAAAAISGVRFGAQVLGY